MILLKKTVFAIFILCLFVLFFFKKAKGGFDEINKRAVQALMKHPAAVEVFSLDEFGVMDA